jgi:peroxidase
MFGTGARTLRILLSAVLALLALTPAARATFHPSVLVRTLDGGHNNLLHPDWGRANTQYLRVAPPSYADGVTSMAAGPPSRYVSNRTFNDIGQNLFSENGISQWGWSWGQFMDHDFGLRDESPGEHAPIAFDASDPLEEFTNDFGAIDFFRTPAAPGTGVTSPRQQINTISSYIDGSGVYGIDRGRLEWLRNGPVDGNLANNRARLLLPNGYLPRADARGDPASAPKMDLMGGLVATPNRAAVAGDVRANENIALTALHTLFAREHNRIVAALPTYLPRGLKFQIARRMVGAEEQFITYNEFLPALGVRLPPYRGYNPFVNPGLGNEFAVVGYRAHSMIHGEFDMTVDADTYSPDQLDAFRAQGIGVDEDGDDEVELEIPLTAAFGNPDLLQAVGIGPFVQSLGAQKQYKNDEQIDNALRSVLFQVPRPDSPDPTACGRPVVNPDCFSGVVDLGAIDIERGRDHGIPSYNDLRRAYGLAPKRSFTAITGEATARFPSDSEIDPSNPIDDPNILDFVKLLDGDGNVIEPGSPEAEEDVVTGIRRTTVAARLKAIYGEVGNLDAFVGMIAERHVPGTEFGKLQLAIWKRQFEALRDGDRFFYLHDPALPIIERVFGISYRHTLAQIISLNTGVSVQPNVFKVENTG